MRGGLGSNRTALVGGGAGKLKSTGLSQIQEKMSKPAAMDSKAPAASGGGHQHAHLGHGHGNGPMSNDDLLKCMIERKAELDHCKQISAEAQMVAASDGDSRSHSEDSQAKADSHAHAHTPREADKEQDEEAKKAEMEANRNAIQCQKEYNKYKLMLGQRLPEFAQQMERIEKGIRHRQQNDAEQASRTTWNAEKRKLQIQQKSLEKHQQYQKKRARFQGYIAKKLDYKEEDINAGKRSLFVDSDNFRIKQESKHLCDLGLSMSEKYGPDTAWVSDLRSTYKGNETMMRSATSVYSIHEGGVVPDDKEIPN